MLPFDSSLANHIRLLLESVDDSNFNSVDRELRQCVECGSRAATLLLQCILDIFGYDEANVEKSQLKWDLISSIFKCILDRPNFCTIFCEAVGSTLITGGFLGDFSNKLNLSTAEKIGVGLALSESEIVDFRTRGQNFSIAQIEHLCANPASSSMSNKQIQDVVLFLYRSEGLSKHVDSFTKMLSLIPLEISNFFVQNPMLTDDGGANSLRQMDRFFECPDSNFESLLEEIEKEISMADILKELGYGCTADISHCKRMLALFLPLHEVTLSKLLGMIARTYFGLDDTQNIHSTFCSALDCSSSCESPLLSSWNIDVLVDAIMQLAPTTDWVAVLGNLDHEGFNLPDETSFFVLMSVYTKACQDPFPLHVICGSVWKNAEGQLSFLRHAVDAPPDVFSFVNCSGHMTLADSVHLSSDDGNKAWYCLDLLSMLCQLAERGHISSVRMMLEKPLNCCPEVLLIGLAHINTPYNLLQYEVFSTVFPGILEDSTKSGIIHHLWQVNRDAVLRAFVDTITDPNYLFRIVDLCKELKVLSTTLDTIPFPVSIRLAAVAYMEEHAILEKWLTKNMRTYGISFFEDCNKFLKEISSDIEHYVTGCIQQSRAAIVEVYKETHSVFYKVLQGYSDKLVSHQPAEELKSLPILSTSKVQPVAADKSVSYGSFNDIEAEANTYFQRLFSGQLSIDVMIQSLACFKTSSDKREQMIFDSMIANIFEEYKFFPRYTDGQLMLAAILIGSLIKHRLLTHRQLDIALRGVLDGLRKSVDSKMCIFGSKALEQFVDRLVEWPQYCNDILKITHLHDAHAGLVSVIKHAVAQSSSSQVESNVVNRLSPDQQGKCSGPAASPKSIEHATGAPASVSSSSGYLSPSDSIVPAGSVQKSSHSTSFGAALNIDTLVIAAEGKDAVIEVPTSEVQDKILFMINNISTANIAAKAVEIAEVLQEQYYPWFAQYMVVKRASIEPNFHDVYLKFIEKVNSKSLNYEIVKASYENCKVLLRSVLIKSSSEERSLLKNLGSWLGKFTIGRNQSLRAKEIDPKALIIEAYEKGLMIAVIPFTSKILEPCLSSLAYRPPNPWTMAILGLLAEIHSLPNLKMNLKFDIEVLFKRLCLNINHVRPTSLLKDKAREVEGNPDFSSKEVPPIVEAAQPDNSESIPNLGQCSPPSPLELERFIQNAMERAVRDVASKYTDGSITVAFKTTKELVLKDHAMETDGSVVTRAARLMVANLAGNLAFVVCRNELQVALSNHIRGFLHNLNVKCDEGIVQSLTTNNLDWCCEEIKIIASQKAVELIDEEIGSLFASMKKQREANGSVYYSAGTYALEPFACTPEILQKQVYDGFGRNIWQAMSNSNVNDLPVSLDLVNSPGNSPMPYICATSSKDSNLNIILASQASPGFTADQPLDWIQEKADGSAQLSYPITPVGPNASIISPIPEIDLTASTHSNVLSPELKMVESSTLIYDKGTAISSSPTCCSNGTALSDSASADVIDNYPPFAKEVAIMFAKWCCTCERPGMNDTAHFISYLQQRGFLIGDEIPDWFFHFLLERSVVYCLGPEQFELSDSSIFQSSKSQQLWFGPIDAYAKFTVLSLEYTSKDLRSSSVNLMAKILSVTVSFIHKDAEENKTFFNPKPYLRLFVNWLRYLSSPNSVLDAANFQVLAIFADAFHALQPLRVPSFSFVWLELVCHKSFLLNLLTTNTPNGWPFVQCLLVDLFKFMAPYLRNAEMSESVRLLYKGTLRLLLILLHDFPEFLCAFHFSFCDVIPHNCIQLRNLILTASPCNMRIPDPHTPNLKFDLLDQIQQAPRNLSDIDYALKAKQMKADIDEYLKNRPEGSTVLADLQQRLLLPQSEASLLGTCYDVPLINSLVLYVGMQDVKQLHGTHTAQTLPTQQMIHSPEGFFWSPAARDIFQSLLNNLDSEGRYFFLNAAVNQLRFPNSHTHYFSWVLLYLFAETSQEIVKEQITRVLLERIIVERPHPWGLIVTFLKLTKNPKYNFKSWASTVYGLGKGNLYEDSLSVFGQKSSNDGSVSISGGNPDSSQ